MYGTDVRRAFAIGPYNLVGSREKKFVARSMGMGEQLTVVKYVTNVSVDAFCAGNPRRNACFPQPKVG